MLKRHVLRRGGLSIIYGDVGLGKSSLMAVLRQSVRTSDLFKQYVLGEILDPSQITDAAPGAQGSSAYVVGSGTRRTSSTGGSSGMSTSSSRTFSATCASVLPTPSDSLRPSMRAWIALACTMPE